MAIATYEWLLSFGLMLDALSLGEGWSTWLFLLCCFTLERLYMKPHPCYLPLVCTACVGTCCVCAGPSARCK
jgi:hypothetical protein